MISEMTYKAIHNTLNVLFAAIWITNGLFCKILNLAPRHQEIVAHILEERYARTITVIIGILETGLGIWIFSKKNSRLISILQIVGIAAMNVLEFFLVPDLLLWGKYNSVFALLLIIAIYYNQFQLNKKMAI